ncbi:MAG: DUF6067 family protein, partial [Kiritimatiellae bacterium]|nr:DUF6067 family protein [Kiritimatiellia bacterium]
MKQMILPAAGLWLVMAAGIGAQEPAQPAPDAANIRNTGAGESDKTPGGWNIEGREELVRLDQAIRPGGKDSLKIEASDTPTGIYKFIPCDGQSGLYKLSAWLKTELEGTTKIHCGVNYCDAEGRILPADPLASGGNVPTGFFAATGRSDWTKYVSYFGKNIPRGAVKIRLWAAVNPWQTPGAKGSAWIDDLKVEPIKPNPSWETGYAPIQWKGKEPAWSEEIVNAGYTVFPVNPLSYILPDMTPEKGVDELKIAALSFPSDRAPLTFCVHTLDKIENLKISASDLVLAGDPNVLIPSAAIDLRKTHYLYRKIHVQSTEYILSPTYLEPFDGISLEKNKTQQFWATVKVPEDARPGKYEGDILISPANAPAKKLRIELEVFAVKPLEPEEALWGMYADIPDKHLLKNHYEDMREHGMNSVCHCGPLGSAAQKDADGKIRIKWDYANGLAFVLDTCRDAGFSKPVMWYAYEPMNISEKLGGKPGSREFAAVFGEIFKRITEEGAKRNWPEIYYFAADEGYPYPFSENRIEMTRVCNKIMRNMGLKTAGHGLNHPIPNAINFAHEYYELMDMILLTFSHPPVCVSDKFTAFDCAWDEFLKKAERDGKKILFYNVDTTGVNPEAMRFGNGLALWIKGARGAFNWHYQSPRKNHYDEWTLPPGKTCYAFRYPADAERRGGPSIGWEATREGVEDYRLLYTLDQLARQAEAAANPEKKKIAREAKKEVAALLSKIDFSGLNPVGMHNLPGKWEKESYQPDDVKIVGGEYKITSGLALDDYDRLRLVLCKNIASLQNQNNKATSMKNDAAATPPEHRLYMTVPKTRAAPDIDGAIGNDEYTFAGEGFLETIYGEYCLYQSRYFLAYDDSRLYIALRTFYCGDDARQKRERGLRILIAPKPDGTNLFEMAIDPFDGVKRTGQNAAVKTESSIQGNIWQAEAAIPFKTLGMDSPGKGREIRLNICRSSPELRVSSCIAPVNRRYEDAANFAVLRFGESSPAVNIGAMGNLAAGYLKPQIKLQNGADSADQATLKTRLQVSGTEKTNESLTIALEPGIWTDASLAPEVFNGSGMLSLRIDSEKHGLLYSARFKMKTKRPLQLQYVYTSPDNNTLKIGLLQTLLEKDGKTLATRVKIKDKQGKELIAKDITPELFDFQAELDIKALPEGDYSLEASLADGQGRDICVVKTDYTRYSSAPWSGNKTGVTDKVPAPWTPLETTGNSVACWGRKYSFENSLLPSQIISQNEPLLAAPINFSCASGGREYAGEFSGMKWLLRSENRVELATTGRCGKINLSCKILVEYDGFAWIETVIAPDTPGQKIDNFKMVIPLRKQHASLANGVDYLLKGTGALPARGWRKNLLQKPAFWIGDNERGLQWFAEDLEGWVAENPEESAVVETVGERSVITLNMIDSPVVLEKSRTIRFGLMATPVRPQPAGWRKWRLRDLGMPFKDASDYPYNLDLWYICFKWCNYPDVNFLIKKEIPEELAGLKKSGVRVCPYLTMHTSSGFSPEWKAFGETWRQTPQAYIPRGELGTGLEWSETTPCMNSGDYRDFYLWKLSKAVRDLDMQGLYFDWGHVMSCDNSLHNCGWQDSKKARHASYTIRGCREIAKRIYVMMKDYHPGAVIAYHMSGEPVMPVHAFADIMVDGENLGSVIAREESYYNLLPLATFRAEYMPYPWGPAVVLLPQFAKGSLVFRPERLNFWKTAEAKKPINHLLGLIMTHGTQCWPNWGVHMDEVWKAQDEFGFDDATDFIPYWNNRDYITIVSPQSENIVVSIYRRKDRFMLVPFNNTDDDVTLKLKINPDNLAFPAGGELKDILAGGFRRTEKNGEVEIFLPKRE